MRRIIDQSLSWITSMRNDGVPTAEKEKERGRERGGEMEIESGWRQQLSKIVQNFNNSCTLKLSLSKFDLSV